MRILIISALLASAAFAQTAINDTLYLQGSTPWTGQITVSWPAFTNCAGVQIAKGSRVSPVNAGAVAISLWATDCASPSFAYSATYKTMGGENRGVTWSETWAIPSSPSIVTLGAVRQSSTLKFFPSQIIAGGLADGTYCINVASEAATGLVACSGGGGGTWDSITGKPATFAPSAHASTHASGGGDPVTLAESQVTGLVSDLAAQQAALDLRAPLANPVFTGTVSLGSTVLDSATAEPMCDSSVRGHIIRVLGASGTADTYRNCVKLADDTYAWIALSLSPCTVDASGNLHCPGAITSGDGGTVGELPLYELATNGDHYTGWMAPDALPSTIRYRLPDTAPAANQLLTCDAPDGTTHIAACRWQDTPSGAGVSTFLTVDGSGVPLPPNYRALVAGIGLNKSPLSAGDSGSTHKFTLEATPDPSVWSVKTDFTTLGDSAFWYLIKYATVNPNPNYLAYQSGWGGAIKITSAATAGEGAILTGGDSNAGTANQIPGLASCVNGWEGYWRFATDSSVASRMFRVGFRFGLYLSADTDGMTCNSCAAIGSGSCSGNNPATAGGLVWVQTDASGNNPACVDTGVVPVPATTYKMRIYAPAGATTAAVASFAPSGSPLSNTANVTMVNSAAGTNPAFVSVTRAAAAASLYADYFHFVCRRAE